MLPLCHPDLDSPLLQETANEVLVQLQDVPESLMQQAKVQQWLAPLFSVSPFIQLNCQRTPHCLRNLLLNEQLMARSSNRSVNELCEWIVSRHRHSLGLSEPSAPEADSSANSGTGLDIAASEASEQQSPTPSPAKADDDEARMHTLRQCRAEEMLRILWRDLTGLASLDETLQALSFFADAAILMAAKWAHERSQQRFGDAVNEQGKVQHMLVLGMGKLGGGELNVSSDIDLIYLYAESGQSNGSRSLDNSEYFRREAQLLTKLLGSVTVDGFVFRVDTRLRPFGESGPLVMNFNALENYYLTQGRDWERYAMIKARPIVGEAADIEAFYELLTPFVYRRYLDYSAIEALRELKRKIAISVRQKSMQENVKLGRGGIREVEFIGQAYQLVRGGQQEKLRIRPIKQVLATLVKMRLMPADDAKALHEAYDFLRETENALQAMRDQQVHSLPEAEEDQCRLVSMLGYQDWAVFYSDLNQQREVVRSRFDALFSDWETEHDAENNTQQDHGAHPAEVVWAILSSPETTPEEAQEAVSDLGLSAGDELMSSLLSLTGGGFYQRLTARAQQRMDRILPLLIDASLQEKDPEETLLRCLGLVRAVAGRSGYIQILIERPPARARLVRLFACSSWVASFVTRHPVVIDELLRDASGTALPDREAVHEEAMQEVQRLAPLDLDEQMDAMRQFQQARELRIVVAELLDGFPIMRISDQLTWLAEAVVQAVVSLVQLPLLQRHGRPSSVVDGRTQYPQMGLVAYGKLGGIELGYGSDLDVVFLHNSSGEQQYTDGEKQIDNGVFYAKLAQKVVHFMGTRTPAGVLYEMDLRLRPNGQSGVLVTSLNAFGQYQLNEAWTWEHQALVRARMVMGCDAVVQEFDGIRCGVLCRQRDHAELRQAVSDMRQKMRDQLGSKRNDLLHLKQDKGAVADIEFIVQYLVLAHASEHQDLVTYTDNIRILEAATNCNVLAAQHSNMLIEHYKSLRSLIHRQSLQKQDALVPLSTSLSELTEQVSELWQQLFDEAAESNNNEKPSA